MILGLIDAFCGTLLRHWSVELTKAERWEYGEEEYVDGGVS